MPRIIEEFITSPGTSQNVNSSSQEETEKLTSEVTALKDSLKSSQDDVGKLTSEVGLLKNSLESKQDEIQKLQSSVTELEESLLTSESENSDLKSQLKEALKTDLKETDIEKMDFDALVSFATAQEPPIDLGKVSTKESALKRIQEELEKRKGV